MTFRSAALRVRICDYCRTMLVRTDGAVTPAGTAAALPFDVSPVQIGTRGRAGDMGFEVIGRVRWAWTDGSWNEWLLLHDDGSHGWLGDAMGQFMLLRERAFETVKTATLISIAKGKKARPGTEVHLDRQKLTIVDARDVLCIAAEGELPFTAPPGWRVYSVDLRGAGGECATLQRDKDSASFYQGRYVTLAELQPRGLRAFEGWSLPRYAS
ncbi:MAG TPA: DUF4178 domain-containing protein [Sphingomonas sp.]|nr:DUF4178 domain-containing protein [Sphingomonas sp.]